MSRNALDRLSDEALVALRIEGEAWPRARTSPTRIPDQWIALVERPDGRRRLVPAGEDPRPERGDQLLLVRHRPIAVPIGVEGTRAASGHVVGGTAEVLVRWQARDDDLAALARTALHEDELSLDALARAVADNGGRAALQQLIRQYPAARLIHEDVTQEFDQELRAQLKRFLFSSGATLERIAKLKLTSAALAEEEALARETAASVERIKARELVQQAALAATQRRLEGLSGIFEQLKGAAAGDEHMQWHDLLPALSPADRGRLLENLWRITPDRNVAAAIIAVTDQECLWLDPACPEQITRRVAVGADLGGLRSVSPCPEKRWLLVGAARGVWAIDAHTGQPKTRFEVPDAGTPRTGFNAVATLGQRLYATHSQLGCWSWALDDPADARCILKPAGGLPKTIRAVTATADGRVAFAADRSMHLYDPAAGDLTSLGDAGDAIHALTIIEDKVFAGTASGKVLLRPLSTSGDWTLVHRGRDVIESIQARRWNDLIELVVPAGADGITGVYAEEGMVARLLETRTPIRRAWACDDLIVGLSDHRDKLIVLNANLPGRSAREAPLARLTAHLVQDACLIISDQAAKPRSDEEETA